MAKVTLVSFYNDFSVGINVLSSILIEAGHDVSVIFFKLPKKGSMDWFSEEAVEFMEAVDSYGNILGGNAEISRWTDTEVELLINQICELSPDVLCFSSRTMDNTLAREVYPKVRLRVDSVILAGGFGPSLNPEIYADMVDYVFVGEAENCIVELVDAIVSGESIKGFDSISYLEGGELIRNKLAPPGVLKFKKQIIPEETFYIDGDKIISYADRGEVVKTHTYSTFLGRGCISTCSYCSTGNWLTLYKNEGHTVSRRRNRPVEDVIEELKGVRDTEITFVHFRDEFMTTGAKELEHFFELYEREVNLPFWAYLVPKQILAHPNILKKALDAGFVDTEMGFQSGSDSINRSVFTRNLPHKETVEYSWMLEKHNVNRQYDFIIFNPAERPEHHKETFKLLQALPKKRAKLFLPRLYYFPLVPIHEILAEYRDVPIDFEHYYSIALLFLICFVVKENEFDQILNDEKMMGSWQKLRDYYREYIESHGIEFPFGSHAVADSITTPRYERILKKHGYRDVIVWGDDGYFNDMESIFADTNIVHFISDLPEQGGVSEKSSPEVLKGVKDEIPLFICSRRKQEIKLKMLSEYSDYPGRVYV